MSEREIQAIREDAAERIERAQARHHTQVIDGLRFLHDHGVIELRFPDWATFAAKLGVELGEIMFDENRVARRATNHSSKAIDDVRRQLSA